MGGAFGTTFWSRFDNLVCEPSSTFRKTKFIFGNRAALAFQIFWKYWKSFWNDKMKAFWKLISIVNGKFWKFNLSSSPKNHNLRKNQNHDSHFSKFSHFIILRAFSDFPKDLEGYCNAVYKNNFYFLKVLLGSQNGSKMDYGLPNLDQNGLPNPPP